VVGKELAGAASFIAAQCDKIYGGSARKGRLAPASGRAACLAAADALASATCTELTPTVESTMDPSSPLGVTCKTAYAGVQKAGDPCLFPDECTPGLACVGYIVPDDTQPGTEGTCAVPPALGAACGPGVQHVDGANVYVSAAPIFGDHPECATGAYCDITCVARKAAGTPCFEDNECLGGMRCHVGVCAAAAPAVAGEPCKGLSDCAFPLRCQGNTGGAAGTCVAPGSRGAACDSDKDCAGRCTKDSVTPGTCASACGSR
jgi:hypothetical protein